MIAGIAIHSSVQRYRMPTRFGITVHEIDANANNDDYNDDCDNFHRTNALLQQNK